MLHPSQYKPIPWPVVPPRAPVGGRALWDGLALAWPFWSYRDGLVADVSGNQLHAVIPTAMGLGAWTVGAKGPELTFGGTSTQRLLVADPASGVLDGMAQFSLEIMFRPAEVISTFQGLAGKYQPATGLRSWRFYLDLDGLEFQASSDGTAFDQGKTTATYSAGTLYQAIVTFNAGALKIYVDGVSQTLDNATLSQTSIYAGGADLVVGQRITSGGSAADTYEGEILSLRIWKGRVLSVEDVRQLYEDPWGMYAGDWGLPAPVVLHSGGQAAGPWTLAGTVAAGIENLLIGGLVNGVEYDLQAFTFDEVPNKSTGSAIIQGTPAAAEQIPLAIKLGTIQRPLLHPFVRKLV